MDNSNVISLKGIGTNLAELHEKLGDELKLTGQTAQEIIGALGKARDNCLMTLGAASEALMNAQAVINAQHDNLVAAITDQFTDRAAAIAEVMDGPRAEAAE